MGSRMAPNLVKSGHKVVVFDVAAPAVQAAVDIGATKGATPKEVAEQADVVVTMLPNGAIVRAAYTGADGVFAGLKEGTLCIDSSTIDPVTSQDMALIAREVHKSGFIDAPVSGGVGGAEGGTLTFMCGAELADFEAAGSVLQHMGKNIVHCGGVGTGQVAKMCNNLSLAISMIGTSEAMLLGKSLGMDPAVLAQIMSTSTARCWSVDTYNPCPGVMEGVPSSRGYSGGFGVDLMLKDLGLATEAAKLSGSPVPLGAAAQQMYALMSAKGEGGKDFSSVFEFLGRNT